MPRLIIVLIVALATGTGLVYAGHDGAPGNALDTVKALLSQLPADAEHGMATATQNAAPKTEEADEDDGVHAREPITKTEHAKPNKSATATNEAGNTIGEAIAAVGGSLGERLSTGLSDTEKLKDDSEVPGDSYLGLEAKLRAAANAIKRDDKEVANRILSAFLHELNAMRQSGHISDGNYNTLYNDYTALVNELGIGATPLPQVSATQPEKGKPSTVPPAGSRGRR